MHPHCEQYPRPRTSLQNCAGVTSSRCGLRLVAGLLYGLFKSVNRSLSLVAAFFSWWMHHSVFRQPLRSRRRWTVFHQTFVGAFNAAQSKMMRFCYSAHAQPSTSHCFFGFYCILIGFLIFARASCRAFLVRSWAERLATRNNFAIFLAIPIPMVLAHLVPILPASENPRYDWLLRHGLNNRRTSHKLLIGHRGRGQSVSFALCPAFRASNNPRFGLM